jgi:[ribosomal protein S18]-alanine N-acetyltransferase
MIDTLITPMALSDVPAVGVIERRNYPMPWSDGIFRDCLKAGYLGFLMKQRETLIGYCMLQIGFEESHVLNLCVDSSHQRQGHARKLIAHMETVSVARQAQTMFLEVRPSNPRARHLYEMNGFNEISVRKDYYDTPTGREDAVVMAKALVA